MGLDEQMDGWRLCSSLTLPLIQCNLLILPTLNQVLDVLKDFAGKSLGEVVCKLVLGGNLNKVNISSGHGAPKMMPLDMKALGASSDALIHGQGQGAIIVLKDGTTDG
jgi:hypothetical protein